MFHVVMFTGVKQTVPVEFTTNSQVDETDYDASLGVKDARSYNEFVVNGHMDEFKYYYRVLSDTGENLSTSLLIPSIQRLASLCDNKTSVDNGAGTARVPV